MTGKYKYSVKDRVNGSVVVAVLAAAVFITLLITVNKPGKIRPSSSHATSTAAPASTTTTTAAPPMSSWNEIVYAKGLSVNPTTTELTASDHFYICYDLTRMYVAGQGLYDTTTTAQAIIAPNPTVCPTVAPATDRALCITRETVLNVGYGNSGENATSTAACALQYANVGGNNMWAQFAGDLTTVCLAYCDPQFYEFSNDCLGGGTWSLTYFLTPFNIMSGTCNDTTLTVSPVADGHGIEFPVSTLGAYGAAMVRENGEPLVHV